MGDKVKTSKKSFSLIHTPNPCSLRDIGVAKKTWQVQSAQARCHLRPLLLAIVHPPMDSALGEWVPGLCLDELIGKRCAAAPHRLSCPHQVAELDSTPRCSRTNKPGAAQVWQRVENSFVWKYTRQRATITFQPIISLKSLSFAFSFISFLLWVVLLQRELQQSLGSLNFGTVVKGVTQNCPLSTFRPQNGLGGKKL